MDPKKGGYKSRSLLRFISIGVKKEPFLPNNGSLLTCSGRVFIKRGIIAALVKMAKSKDVHRRTFGEQR